MKSDGKNGAWFFLAILFFGQLFGWYLAVSEIWEHVQNVKNARVAEEVKKSLDFNLQYLKGLSKNNVPRVAKNGSYYGEISKPTGRPKTIYVRGYYKKDGTYVRSHYRSRPRRW